MTNLSDHFQRLPGERSNRAIATRIDVDPSTLNRQLNGATAITVETVEFFKFSMCFCLQGQKS